MADLTVQQKQIFNNYKKTHPKMSDAEILSALVNLGQIQLSEEQKLSLFNNPTKDNSSMGLKLEHTQKSANPTNQPQETVFLQSGRKIVITKSQDGKDVYKYYATDGTQLKPEYFKQQEGVVRVSANRKTYTVTKNGNTTVKEAKDPLMAKIDQQQAELNKTKNEQGFLGKSWDWFKNTTGIGDGSNKAQKQLDAERKLVQQIQNGKISKKDFKDVTGLDYSQENLQKFKNGEIELKSTEKIKGYQEGQEMACDVAGDLVSGIAAVGIYSLAVAAAPFTGGASIAIGVGAAALSGAAIKAGIKALDAKTAGRKYSLKDFGHDSATGAFSGLLAPITGGMGGAVGKTVATKLGVQAVKSVGKEVAETVVETGVKQGVKEGIKTALVNPTGYEYIGGTLVKRAAAMSAEMATDGALGGALDGGFRAGYENDWDGGAILDGTIQGGVGGAIMAPAIGGGMKLTGKAGHSLGARIKKFFGWGKKANNVIENTMTKETANNSSVYVINPENNQYGIQRVKGRFVGETVYYKGQPVATTKRQLKKQIRAKEKIDTKRLPWQIEDFLETLKTKEDIQKASMLISDLNKIGPSGYQWILQDKGYLTMCESLEDIPIIAMLGNHIDFQGYENSAFKIIKDKSVLYEFFNKGDDIFRENILPNNYCHIGYTLFDIAKGIETREQVQAAFEIIKAIKGQTSYERKFIGQTINKFVKSADDIESYKHFMTEFCNMSEYAYTYCHYDNEEYVNAIYRIFTEEPRFTHRGVNDLLCLDGGKETVEQINRLNSILKLKERGFSEDLAINLCCSTLDDDGKFAQNRLDVLLRENNPVDMILKILDEPGGRFTARLTLLKSAVTGYEGKVDKEAFTKLLELYQTKIPDAAKISDIYKYCHNYDGTVNPECIKAVEDIIDSGYPYYTIDSILKDMSGLWYKLPKEEFVSILKDMAKANPKILERDNGITCKFGEFAKATDYARMEQETKAAIKLMKNGICADTAGFFDNENNFIRLFRRAKKENGTIDDTIIDKAIELYKLSIPHNAVDLAIDYDIARVKQLYNLGFRDLNLFYMYDVSDKARDFILKNIPIDKLEYADIRIVNLAADFLEYNSVLEMDKITKQNFLSCIMRSNGFLLDAKNIKDYIKILPTTPEEYVKTVKQLAKSLNIEIKKLSDIEIETLNKHLDDFCTTLERIDLSTLEKVELTYPQSSFVKEVQEITSNLTPQERAQLYDSFGFTIKDDRLSGYPKIDMNDLDNHDTPRLMSVFPKLIEKVRKYTDNNFITVKDNPELNSVLKNLSSSMPELFRQVDGSSIPVSVIKALQEIVKSENYKLLSESDKKIITLATLLHKTDTSGSTVGSAFDAFFIVQKFGFTESECQKLYKIIQTSDAIEKFMSTTKGVEHSSNTRYGVKGINRQVEFDYIAFLLKEDNNFELAKMLYRTKEEDGFTRYFDKMLEQRIKEIKSHDFVLPQTSKDEILKHSTNLNIKGYNVKVAYANDIPDFYAFIHTPERGFASSHSTSRDMKFANFDVFKIPADDKVICTCYIGNGRYGTPASCGFIFDVQPENMYVGLGYDMSSTSKKTRDLMIEFFRNTGLKAASGKGNKFDHRTMISNSLKAILNISDDEYIKRVDRIKKLSKGKTLTLNLIEEIDEKVGKAYKEFLSRDNTGGVRNKDALLRGDGWNEVLVSNPEVKAIYTKDLDNIPEEYLIKAQEENLPIIIIK